MHACARVCVHMRACAKSFLGGGGGDILAFRASVRARVHVRTRKAFFRFSGHFLAAGPGYCTEIFAAETYLATGPGWGTEIFAGETFLVAGPGYGTEILAAKTFFGSWAWLRDFADFIAKTFLAAGPGYGIFLILLPKPF